MNTKTTPVVAVHPVYNTRLSVTIILYLAGSIIHPAYTLSIIHEV